MDRSFAGPGDRGIQQQIGAHRRSGMKAEEQNKQRVINDPPPTPVKPTTKPTPNPDKT
jgi:hypothetical protein